MKRCDCCGRMPCVRPRVVLEHCEVCKQENSRYNLEWVGKPNPCGAWRGEVFSHWLCKDTAKCLDRTLAKATA